MVLAKSNEHGTRSEEGKKNEENDFDIIHESASGCSGNSWRALIC
jgi:hypothetical protein